MLGQKLLVKRKQLLKVLVGDRIAINGNLLIVADYIRRGKGANTQVSHLQKLAQMSNG